MKVNKQPKHLSNRFFTQEQRGKKPDLSLENGPLMKLSNQLIKDVEKLKKLNK